MIIYNVSNVLMVKILLAKLLANQCKIKHLMRKPTQLHNMMALDVEALNQMGPRECLLIWLIIRRLKNDIELFKEVNQTPFPYF